MAQQAPDRTRPGPQHDVSSRTHRVLLAVVGVLLVATLVGMVLLWPASADVVDAEGEPLDDLVAGEILDIELFEREVVDDVMGMSGETAALRVLLLDGPDEGEVLDLEVGTDGFPDMAEGDRVQLDRSVDPEGETQYFITDFQRLPALAWLVGLFVVAVLVISRWHGLRALLGLGMSLAIVVRFIVPAILDGQSPPLVALVGALAVMIVTLYLTHGVNELTTAAVVGTAGALSLTVALGLLFIDRGRITGFASDDAVYAGFAVEGLDLQGLVLAGLIIAALGVLDDVTIAQSSTVFALHDTDRTLNWTTLFARAMKVGRDHIASVVNTLFLAYTGASIALLLLFSTGGVGVMEILNTEVLAVEIVKTVVGSLGLIAAVPLTTALATTVAIQRPADAPPIGGGHHHGPAATDTGAAIGGRRRRRAVAATAPGPGPAGEPAPDRADRPVPAPGDATPGGAGEHAPRGARSEHEGAQPDPAPSDEDLDDEERARRAWAAYLGEDPEAPAGHPIHRPGEPRSRGSEGHDEPDERA